MRYAIEGGGILVGYNIKAATNPQANQNNSVSPAWWETLTHFILVGLWDNDATFLQMQAVSETMTNDWMDKWRAASLGARSYISEGDINEPGFQQVFYGAYYSKLYAIKQ